MYYGQDIYNLKYNNKVIVYKARDSRCKGVYNNYYEEAPNVKRPITYRIIKQK